MKLAAAIDVGSIIANRALTTPTRAAVTFEGRFVLDEAADAEGAA